MPLGLIRMDSEGVTFQVRVTPRAAHDQVGPVVEDGLRIKVTAPPVEGEANKAVVALLARAIGVPKSAVQIVAGAGGRRKVIRVLGATLPQIEALFSGSTGTSS
jgi:uncharacterized protein (TIGR00251 family)